MQAGPAWKRVFYVGVALLIGAAPARCASTVSAGHPSAMSLPGATGTLFQMQSASVTNSGSTLSFNVSFFNPATIQGPSTGTASTAVYGFFNLDTDQRASTGLTPSALNGGFEGGFGQFVPSSLGTDAFISLTSEGNLFGHALTPGLVDLVRTSDGTVLDTVAITYTSSPRALSFALPVSDFSSLPGFSTLQNGGPLAFSVVVGNASSATDVLTSPAVPEPAAILLGAEAVLALLGISIYRVRRGCSRPTQAQKSWPSS